MAVVSSILALTLLVISTSSKMVPKHGLNITEICINSNIPLSKCNCNDRPGLCGTVSPRKVTIPSGASLETICQLLSIKNCTCHHPIVKTHCEKPPKKYIINCTPSIKRFRAIFTIIFSIIGFVGNGFVMIVTMVNWERSTKCHKLIGGLAVADFVFSIIQVIDVSPYLRGVCDFIYGQIGCKLISLLILSSWISIGFILIITLERFIGIIYPFSRGLSSLKLKSIVLLNTIFSIGMVIPVTIVLEYDPIPKRCFENWAWYGHKEASRIYTYATLLLNDIIPLIILISMYGKIIHRLLTTTSEINNFQQNQRQKENKRIIVILLLVVICYFVLVIPDRIGFIFIEEHLINLDTSKSNSFTHLKLYMKLPIVVHVAVNPVIYSIVDQKFRKSLIRILTKRNLRRNNDYSGRIGTKSSSNFHSSEHIKISTKRNNLTVF